jgi:glutamine---fructose-6-phosphate transaminase (isomerizing)
LCGIAGFISNNNWTQPPDAEWLSGVLAAFQANRSSEIEWLKLNEPLGVLSRGFDTMMSFGFHWLLVQERPELSLMRDLADHLETGVEDLEKFMTHQGRTHDLEYLSEQMRDSLWQIRQEALANIDRTIKLLPVGLRKAEIGAGIHFTAWSIEQVLENIDRLEVRGRDSAGISLLLMLPDNADNRRTAQEFESIAKIENGVKISADAYIFSGSVLFNFTYKIANLVGRLGDNTAGVRSAVRNDRTLWEISSKVEHINIIAHTRWASNGIISLGNCHPVDGSLFGPDHAPTMNERGAQFVLNGDVDNYKTLVDQYVEGQGFKIEPSITTDAKILPVFYRLGAAPDDGPEARFALVLNKCEGSLAIVMQSPLYPRKLFLGEKGSGQSLNVGKIYDGFIMSSEVYGLAARTRTSWPLVGTDRGGTQITIDAETNTLSGRYLDNSQAFEIQPEQIYIHSRDIYRGDFNYYFEKEIYDAPNSVRKTIKDKYRKISDKIHFAKDGLETFSALLNRLNDKNRPSIRRIMVIGQGTASIAAMGTAYLIEKALAGARITVSSSKSSELSGFLSDDPLDDMLLVAISQSGTTTDTNRTVDVVGSQGAWVHSIVNRRNSALVTKSDSFFYTSDGRDVEMAVASTKAFYSQITAGKLLALFLAQELGTLSDDEIFEEITELEKLPFEIEYILRNHQTLKDSAEKYGPSSRNWAVVGNGANKIAADEIRIKLSELCYKSIPCDYTEDKKHIDLSTEPLTIVVANELPEQIVQDTAKEVAIFKAHNGKPIVIAAKGEKRFNQYAESLLELPTVGAGLNFVLATVAGHLWGFYAAKAIDARAEEFRNIRTMLAKVYDDPASWNPDAAQARLWYALKQVSSGEFNASLPASTAASLAVYSSELAPYPAESQSVIEQVSLGISILNKAIEEMTRPIDTIRHQAKTVTVGISRPQEILPAILLGACELLRVEAAQIKEQDRRILRLVSPAISGVMGGVFYDVVLMPGDGSFIQATRKTGVCEGKDSRYDQPRLVGGSKRTALRLERTIWTSGPKGDENLVIVPLFDEESGEAKGIILFHLAFASQVATQQKMGILRGLGSRYHEFVERIEEVSSKSGLEAILERTSPRDLILAPVEKIISAENDKDSKKVEVLLVAQERGS